MAVWFSELVGHHPDDPLPQDPVKRLQELRLRREHLNRLVPYQALQAQFEEELRNAYGRKFPGLPFTTQNSLRWNAEEHMALLEKFKTQAEKFGRNLARYRADLDREIQALENGVEDVDLCPGGAPIPSAEGQVCGVCGRVECAGGGSGEGLHG